MFQCHMGGFYIRNLQIDPVFAKIPTLTALDATPGRGPTPASAVGNLTAWHRPTIMTGDASYEIGWKQCFTNMIGWFKVWYDMAYYSSRIQMFEGTSGDPGIPQLWHIRRVILDLHLLGALLEKDRFPLVWYTRQNWSISSRKTIHFGGRKRMPYIVNEQSASQRTTKSKFGAKLSHNHHSQEHQKTVKKRNKKHGKQFKQQWTLGMSHHPPTIFFAFPYCIPHGYPLSTRPALGQPPDPLGCQLDPNLRLQRVHPRNICGHGCIKNDCK